MAILFNRKVELSIITTQNERIDEGGFSVPSDDDEIITIKGARISFDFTKGNTASPNRGIVKVWGLAENTINQFLAGDILSLNVGYDEVFEALSGEISAVKSVESGESRIVEFEMIDGLSIEETTANRSFAAGTGLLGMIKSLFGDVRIRNLSDLISVTIGGGVGDDTLKNELIVSGPIVDPINEMTEDLGVRWFNDGGNIKIITKDGSTLEEVIEVSANTGLINAAERTEQGIAFTTLLNPRLTPGRKVEMRSGGFDGINGLLVIQSVRLEGDNEQEQPFYCHCEAVELVS